MRVTDKTMAMRSIKRRQRLFRLGRAVPFRSGYVFSHIKLLCGCHQSNDPTANAINGTSGRLGRSSHSSSNKRRRPWVIKTKMVSNRNSPVKAANSKAARVASRNQASRISNLAKAGNRAAASRSPVSKTRDKAARTANTNKAPAHAGVFHGQLHTHEVYFRDTAQLLGWLRNGSERGFARPINSRFRQSV
jgi:hypothetical protein